MRAADVHEKVMTDRFKAVTPNEKHIDILIRRLATHSGPSNESRHLDADEMSAFAEGTLPEVARAQYVSHLADCDRCRKQVSSLALAAGAVTRTESLADKGEHRNFWQVLTALFALPVLRYATFGALFLIVAGVAFIALRPRAEPRALVAANESKQQEALTAVKTAPEENGRTDQGGTNSPPPPGSPSPPPPRPNLETREGPVARNIPP